MPIARIREIGAVSILDIEGRIDINSSDIIEAIGSLANSGRISVILNLDDVSLIDYSGLSILTIAYKNMLNHHGMLRFLNTPVAALELFRVVKLDRVFELFDDEDAAIASFTDVRVDRLHLRRKFKRLDIHLIAHYRTSKGKPARKMLDGKVLNVSAAGIFIHTPYIMEPGTIIELEVEAPDQAAAFDARGKVVWIADPELQPHCYPGMGIAFEHLPQEKERSLIEFIDKNIISRTDGYEA